eukprot:gene1581-1675_t
MTDLQGLLRDENIPSTRREIKRKIISLQTMLRVNEMTADNRKLIEKNIAELRKHSTTFQPKVDKEELEKRRSFIENNPGLKDIFQTLWAVFFKYTNDGYLSKEGYMKFNHSVLISLGGLKSFEDVGAMLESDWHYDKSVFGPFDSKGFFDLLFETIEMWTEVVNPNYYAAFAWALLDSIADTTAHPPKLRPLREIRCVTKLDNEMSMINSYLKNKRIRAALSIENEWLMRVPEVQKRLQSRKLGTEFTLAHQSMVEVITHSLRKSQLHDGFDDAKRNDDDHYSDSDAGSVKEELTYDNLEDGNEKLNVVSVINGLLKDPPALTSQEDEREDDEISDAASSRNSLEKDRKGYGLEQILSPPKGFPDREDDNDSFQTQNSEEDELLNGSNPTLFEKGAIPFRARKAYIPNVLPNATPNRKSTISFMSYVESRRKSRLDLNGAYFARQNLSSSFRSSFANAISVAGTDTLGGTDREDTYGTTQLSSLAKEFANYVSHGNVIESSQITTSSSMQKYPEELSPTNWSQNDYGKVNERYVDNSNHSNRSVSFEIETSNENQNQQFGYNYGHESKMGDGGREEKFLQVRGRPLPLPNKILRNKNSMTSSVSSNASIADSGQRLQHFEDLQAFLLKFDASDLPAEKIERIAAQTAAKLTAGNTYPTSITPAIPIPAIVSKEASEDEVERQNEKVRAKKNLNRVGNNVDVERVRSGTVGARQRMRNNVIQDSLTQLPPKEQLSSSSMLMVLPTPPPLLNGPIIRVDMQDVLTTASSVETTSSSLKAVHGERRREGKHSEKNFSNDPLSPQIVSAWTRHAHLLQNSFSKGLKSSRTNDELLYHLQSFLGNQDPMALEKSTERFSTLIPSKEDAVHLRSSMTTANTIASSSSSVRNSLKLLPSSSASEHRNHSRVGDALNVSSSFSIGAMEIKAVDLQNRETYSKGRFKPKSLSESSGQAIIVFDRDFLAAPPTTPSISTVKNVPTAPSFRTPLQPLLSNVEAVAIQPSQTLSEPLPITDSIYTEESLPSQKQEGRELHKSAFTIDALAVKESKIEFESEVSPNSSAQKIHEKFHSNIDPQSSADMLLSIRREKYEYSYQLSDALPFHQRVPRKGVMMKTLQLPSRSPINSPNQKCRTFLTITGSDSLHLHQSSFAHSPSPHHHNNHEESLLIPHPPTAAPWLKNSDGDGAILPVVDTIGESTRINTATKASYLQKEVLKNDNIFNRSNRLDIWRDKLELLKLPNPTDTSLNKVAIRRQLHHRQQFEEFAKRSFKNHTTSISPKSAKLE